MICRWSNGTEAKLFGAHSPEDVERFRAGGNRCLVWAEEMAAWRYLEEAWAQIKFGLRVGPRPHSIISTTPRKRKLIRDLVEESKQPKSRIIVSHGSTESNPYLHDETKTELYKEYGGTRLGRQELHGELLEDVENALWTDDLLDMLRIHELMMPHDGNLDRVGVAVDPAASEHGDEHGIIVGGISYRYDRPGVLRPDETHGFVLEDCSLHGTPNQWGRRVVRAYREHNADFVVAEKNNGGDMVANVILGIDPTIPVYLVHASRGKTKRAEPVANLYSQMRIHHVGSFPELEDQMTMWDPQEEDPGWSPDRMDALVWLFTELMLETMAVQTKKPKDRRLTGRR